MGDLTDRATQGAEFPKPVCCLAPPLTNSPPSLPLLLLWPGSVVCQGASPSVQVRATVYDCVPGFNLFSPSITSSPPPMPLIPLPWGPKKLDLAHTASITWGDSCGDKQRLPSVPVCARRDKKLLSMAWLYEKIKKKNISLSNY